MTERAPTDAGAPERLILVVDDDPLVRRLVRRGLEGEFRVVEATNGREALRQFYDQRPDLVVLDTMMPAMDGWTTLARIREMSDTPVIMLTGLGDEASIVRALDAGADEYVTKPFTPRAFAARLRAVLRRATCISSAESSRLELDGGRFVLDRAAARVWVRGEEVRLSPTEYRLLVCLANHLGRVLPVPYILREVWGPEYGSEPGYIKNYVRLLRAKVESDPRAPRYIISRRGLGYMLSRGDG